MKQINFITLWWIAFILANIGFTIASSFYPDMLDMFILNSYANCNIYMYASVNIPHALINAAMLLGLLDYYKDYQILPLILVPIVGILTGLLHFYFFPEKPILGYSGAILGLYGFMTVQELFIDFKKTVWVHVFAIGVFIYGSYLVDKYSNIIISHEAHLIGFSLGAFFCMLIFALDWLVGRVRK
jgi:membrane associated rhomboid family serine protease